MMARNSVPTQSPTQCSVPTQFLLRSRRWPKSTMHIQSTRYDTIIIQNARIYLSKVEDPHLFHRGVSAWRGGTQFFELGGWIFPGNYLSILCSCIPIKLCILPRRPHILPRSCAHLCTWPVDRPREVSQFLQHGKSEAIAGKERSYHVMYQQTS